MRHVLPGAVLLLLVPAAAGLSLTVHSPEPGGTYNVSASLNYSTDTAANITKTYGVGNGSHHANTTGETKLIYGDGSHVLTLKAVAFSNGSEQAAAQVPFTIQNGSHSPTEITGCADLVSSGTYELVNDITTNPRQTCMELQQSDFNPRDITLDCQGHIIDGVDAFGQVGVALTGDRLSCFDASGERVVKNCRITNYCHAIEGGDLQNFYTVTDNAFVSGAPYQRCGAIDTNRDAAITITGNRFEGNAASFSGFFIGGVRYDCRPNLAYNNLFQDQRFATDDAISEHMEWYVSPRPGDRVVGSGQVGGNAYTTPTGTGFSDTCTDSDGDRFCDQHFNVDTQQPTSVTGSFIDQYPLKAGPVAPPEIEDTSFTLSPFPAETEQTVTVSVVVARADNVTVQTRVDGDAENHTVTSPAAGDTWNITLPEEDTAGKRVDVTVYARNPAGTDVLSDTADAYPATELPVGGERPKTQLHYFVFNETRKVPVVLARFADQFVYNETEFDNRSEVRQWERAREFDINSYYGSGRGSMGAIGYDFTYLDNNLEFYEVEDKAEYNDSLLDAVDNRIEFTNKAQEVADVNQPFIGTHPGSAPKNMGSAAIIRDGIGVDVLRIYATMTARDAGGDDHYGIWIHEIGHLIGLGDLYSKEQDGDVAGGIDDLGVMAGGTGIHNSRLPAPFTVLSRTSLNNNTWLGQEVWFRSELELLGSVITANPALEGQTLDSNVSVFNTEFQNQHDETIKYAIEARGTRNNGIVVIYKVAQPGEDPITKANNLENETCKIIAGENCSVDDAAERDSIQDLISNESETFANFTLVDENGSGAGYIADVKIEVSPWIADTTVTAIDDPIKVPNTYIAGEALDVLVPDIDLKAVNEDGQLVGNNGTRYVTEIRGAKTSFDRLQGNEWISLPDTEHVRYIVDASDVERYANALNLSDAERDNLSQTIHLTTINYGSNPQLVNNTAAVNDTVVTDTPVTVQPGEQTVAALRGTVDIDPNTINLNAQSKWVTAYIELPRGHNTIAEDGENTTAINISTVQLNGAVPAVDNEQYGFVKDPELKDRDDDGRPETTVKFSGDEVRPMLDTGREKLTVTGETVKNQVFSTSDRVRVIDRGSEVTGMVAHISSAALNTVSRILQEVM